MVHEARYLPFGEEWWVDGEGVTDFGFTGQRVDGFGLSDYNARFYSSRLGRFISPDSIVPEPRNPQAWNRYAYTLNNPVRFTDPTGHYTFEEEPDDSFYIPARRSPTGENMRVANDPCFKECTGHVAEVQVLGLSMTTNFAKLPVVGKWFERIPGLNTRGVERVWNNKTSEAENFFFFGGAGAVGDNIGSGKGWGAGWNVSLYWGEVYGLDNIEDYEQKYINYNFTAAYGPIGLRANHAQGADNSNIVVDTIGWAIGAGLDASVGRTNHIAFSTPQNKIDEFRRTFTMKNIVKTILFFSDDPSAPYWRRMIR